MHTATPPSKPVEFNGPKSKPQGVEWNLMNKRAEQTQRQGNKEQTDRDQRGGGGGHRGKKGTGLVKDCV